MLKKVFVKNCQTSFQYQKSFKDFGGILQLVKEQIENPQNQETRPGLILGGTKYCENCGKVITVIYGSGRFCNASCKSSFNAKSRKMTEERKAQLAKARSKRTFNIIKDLQYCSFCKKECKNKNSLINHERLCKENPNRIESPFKRYNDLGLNRGHNQYTKAKELGLPKPEMIEKQRKSISERMKANNPSRKEEVRKKISESIKKAHDEGRGHTWIHRPDNPSYAEQWLYGFLDARNVQYKKEVPFKGFFLDVLVGNDKVIEIDEEQQYSLEKFQEIIERVQRKDKLLKENGYKELRLRWSLVQSDKENQVKILESFLNI